MISVLITSYNEPTSVGKALQAFLNQTYSGSYEILVSSPDDATASVAMSFDSVKVYKDKGVGKNYALNLLFKKAKGDIVVLSDGDVFVDKDALKNLIEHFNDKTVGVVAGRPVSLNNRNTMMGYWSHVLFDAGAHMIRKKLFNAGKFIECSGYLFAFRNNIIQQIPFDVAEDSIIPYLFYRKGYKIAYAEGALVFVKNPLSLNEWVKQKKRTAKGHVNLKNHFSEFPYVKSFGNEIKYGTYAALSYPITLKEFLWTIPLFLARLFVWLSLFYDIKIKKDEFIGKWERIKSTK